MPAVPDRVSSDEESCPSPPTVLAPLVDGVVLVVRSGTRAQRVQQALQVLSAVSARLLGAVLTMA